MGPRRGTDPSAPARPALPRVLATALACALAFAGLTVYVLASAPTTRLDRQVQRLAFGHRTPWVNAVMETWTWLGSTVVLVPVLVVVTGYLWWRRRDLYAVAFPWVALGGAVVLYQVFKTLVGRARPPVSQMLVHASGYAYPSGHATQAITVWGLLAVLAVTESHWRARPVRTAVAGVAGIMIVLVGASRIYLGVHWVTDVVGGFALGAAWVALLLAGGLWRGVVSRSERLVRPRSS